jgi:replicative DNA helicase
MSRIEDRAAAMARTRDNPFERQLPANIEAEQALLGALLVNNAAYHAILPTGIEAKHFYEPIHRTIFEAAKSCITSNKIANPVTIRSFIAPDILNKPIGDMTVGGYTARLCSEATSIVNAPDYAGAVIFYAHRRDVLPAADIIDTAACNAQDELAFVDQIREARDRLGNVLAAIEKNDAGPSFVEEVDGTLDQTDQAARGIELKGIDPGVPELVSMTGLWEPGQLIFIIGDVKTGKSGLAWQIVFNIAERFPVAGYSGEMPRAQVIRREKARRTGISDKRQRRGQVSQLDMDDLVRAGADMKRLKVVEIDCQKRTLDQLDARIERLKAEYGIVAYCVDHVLNLEWTGKTEDLDDFKKANRAAARLKDIAMKHGIVVLALTHINKTGSQDAYGKTFEDRLRSAQRRRPSYKNAIGNIDKNVDNLIITHQTLPSIAALEPEEGTANYAMWQAAMEDAKGKAELILALSRENEFPRRKEIEWHGETTSYGRPFKQVQNDRGLF